MNQTYSLIGSNGTVINFDDIGYSISQDNLSGLSTYPVSYDTSAPPGYLGAIVNSSTIRPRQLSFQITLWGSGRADLEYLRQRLIDALNPTLGAGKFCWRAWDGNTYVLDVTPADGSPAFSGGTRPDATSWVCSCTLIAHNPTWKLSTADVVTIAGIGGGFTLPFHFPFSIGQKTTRLTVNNTGSAVTPVLIEMYGKLVSPIELKNETTGETITIRKTIYSGEKLTIDTSDENLSVTFTDTDGNTSNALHYCAVGSRFWQLKSGANQISYSAEEEGSTASGTLTYTRRWLAR